VLDDGSREHGRSVSLRSRDLLADDPAAVVSITFDRFLDARIPALVLALPSTGYVAASLLVDMELACDPPPTTSLSDRDFGLKGVGLQARSSTANSVD
jgi:hypothetical protein